MPNPLTPKTTCPSEADRQNTHMLVRIIYSLQLNAGLFTSVVSTTDDISLSIAVFILLNCTYLDFSLYLLYTSVKTAYLIESMK